MASRCLDHSGLCTPRGALLPGEQERRGGRAGTEGLSKGLAQLKPSRYFPQVERCYLVSKSGALSALAGGPF